MGTLTIVEYNSVGTIANRDTPIADLNAITKTTVDSTTGSTAESLTLTPQTKLITVVGDETHRISVLSTDCTELYAPVGTVDESFGVKQGQTLYYRTDA